MGVEVAVEGLTKSFGSQNIWRDVTLTLPAGEVNALLGPSGTGKSVFLKTLIGLLHPEQGSVIIDGTDITQCSAKELYEIRKLFGVLFQDGALFGSMSLYDNIAFPLREHTKKKEDEIRRIVMDKVELVGLAGAEDKLPGEISGGMRKRAGLARALVLDPEIILCDEPDSGLDPVRTAYISQLLIDINAEIDATILIVTHNINIARTIPDNIGMLFRKELVMFGPREVLLTSEQPVVKQFLSGDRFGPIGMSEEKDEAVAAQEAAMQAAGISGGGTKDDFSEIIPQVQPNPGMPVRQAAIRHRQNVLNIINDLPPNAQAAIRASIAEEDRRAAESPDTSATLVAMSNHQFDYPTGVAQRYDGATEVITSAGGVTEVIESPTQTITLDDGAEGVTETIRTVGEDTEEITVVRDGQGSTRE
ncbi:ABC transporter ATP-binding protein [Gordonia sp. (in: high G+C Gram-positive bacteria)]|uniref:ABC transporter ATP-binding protein n=1 Tax=Gordonia sp. (in: high G+C Gram-positive bacteria) TaxID=84139 RepID=UPI00260BB18D|nr:ABC transporter ATP-binding protein [Gordonia sp. (in: high G+C Gram-positive bacteria)]